MLKKLKLKDSMKVYKISRTNTPKNVVFIIGDWNVKVRSQETPGVTGKFGLGIRNEAGQRLIELCQGVRNRRGDVLGVVKGGHCPPGKGLTRAAAL